MLLCFVSKVLLICNSFLEIILVTIEVVLGDLLRRFHNDVILHLNVVIDLRNGSFDMLDALLQFPSDRLNLERLVF